MATDKTADTQNYMAWCVAHTETSERHGRREHIKTAAWADAVGGPASAELLERARATISCYIAESEGLSEFERNLKTVLGNKRLARPNSFVACAPLAFARRMKRKGEKNERKIDCNG